MRDLPQGTVTFMFTDVQASTDLTRRLGERYAGVLSDSRRLLEALAEHGGVEVDTQGDGLRRLRAGARRCAGGGQNPRDHTQRMIGPARGTCYCGWVSTRLSRRSGRRATPASG